MKEFISKYDLIKYFGELGFKVGAEIGVADGYFSLAMFKAIPGLKLYMIDNWNRYGENHWRRTKDIHNDHYELAKERVKGYDAELIREKSLDAVKKFDYGSLDFVFIDANHSFDYVMQDIILWTKRVREYGIVSGDDYYHFKWGGVIDAVEAYTKHHGIKYYVTKSHENNIMDRGSREAPVFYWVRT